LIRAGIRRLCAERLREERAHGGSLEDLIDAGRRGPLAPVPEKANEQHYELPARFFAAVLGARLKYSCGYWPNGVETLDQAEEAALAATCERAQLADDQDILELGCGWGSLSLWMAERYPGSRIAAVSNSASQRQFIERRARDLGLSNLRIITCDMNDFQARSTFDRIVSVEMFEHMRNYEELLRRIAGWLRPDGKLFVHIFCHLHYAYEFQTQGSANWLGRHFFTGGVMPSYDLLGLFPKQMSLAQAWPWDGRHYERTANAWLRNMDARKAEVLATLSEAYGPVDAARWLQRWRIFFMACAELWGYDQGRQWLVGHYLLEKPSEAQADRDRDRPAAA
jgi:cyclopropane-fatty-acyl-phospholipid synthase